MNQVVACIATADWLVALFCTVGSINGKDNLIETAKVGVEWRGLRPRWGRWLGTPMASRNARQAEKISSPWLYLE